ncbi:MAG: hypothetical protein ACLR2O_12415 [Coprococcus sp.]
MTDYPNNIPAKLEIITTSEIIPERGALAVVSPYSLRQSHAAARRSR